jgi:hypothetical protein
MPVILATREREIGRISVQGQQASSLDPISKTKTKWVGGVAQVVECLLYKIEALNSNSNPT